MSQLTRRPLDLPSDASALFSSLQHLPWAMLLDSCTPDSQPSHPDSRFDILCADPIGHLICRGNTTQVRWFEQQWQSQEDPLALLDELIARMPQYPVHSDSEHHDLPFVGGAVGHFSYDLGRRFETLPSQTQDEIELPEMAIGLFDWAVIIDKIAGRVELVVQGDESRWQQRFEWLQNQIGHHRSQSQPFALTSAWQQNTSKAAYREAFAKVQEYLRAGDCYQINLTQRFKASYQGDEWQAYQQLRAANQAPFSAFIRLPDAALLSVSPERFLSVDGKQVQTKPIKGTRPRHQDPQQDKANANELAHAPKDRAENLMIVDLLRNDLGRAAAPGSVRVPELFAIESFAAVHHLVSTVTAELAEGVGACDLLRGAFPGGSITGAPKIRAMEIIEELEPYRRSLYCGSIGYLSCHGKMDTSITIRSLVAKQQNLYCWAGGGIVADSQVDAEYQECFDKLAKILPVLESAVG